MKHKKRKLYKPNVIIVSEKNSFTPVKIGSVNFLENIGKYPPVTEVKQDDKAIFNKIKHDIKQIIDKLNWFKIWRDNRSLKKFWLRCRKADIPTVGEIHISVDKAVLGSDMSVYMHYREKDGKIQIVKIEEKKPDALV